MGAAETLKFLTDDTTRALYIFQAEVNTVKELFEADARYKTINVADVFKKVVELYKVKAFGKSATDNKKLDIILDELIKRGKKEIIYEHIKNNL